MNILFLAEPTFPRHRGGGGLGTHILAAALQRRGHQVRIACQCHEPSEVEVIDGVEVHRVNWDEVSELPGRAGEIATANAMRQYLERNIELAKVDVLFDSGAFLSFFHRLAYDLKKRYGLPFVLQFRYLVARHVRAVSGGAGAELDASALGLECCVEDSSQCFPSRFADEVLCISQEDADFVAAALRPTWGPHVLSEPIEPVQIDPQSTARVRAELLAPGEQLLFFGGRIDDTMKGGDVVQAALDRILSARPNTRLLLLPREESWLLPYRRFGSAIIARPWVRDRVELAALMSATDVLLMPSAYEPFGLVCAEALQVGCPVVATRVGGLKDQIVHGENGFLVSGATVTERAEQVAQYTLQILSDPQLAARLSKAAVSSAKRYSSDLVAAQAEAICERVVARVRASQGASAMISPPVLPPDEERRYLDLVRQYGGETGESAGRANLDQLNETASARCTSCTRARMARDTRALMELGRRSRGIWGRFFGPSVVDRRSAVEATCPLALLQKHS